MLVAAAQALTDQALTDQALSGQALAAIQALGMNGKRRFALSCLTSATD
jgi:hypothetical protein